MTFWRSMALSAAVLVGASAPGGAALAAANGDPDWPCIQRLVPEIAPAVVWAGPPLDSINGEPSPAIQQLAEELAARRVPLAEAEAQVEAFASGLAPEQKDAQLTLLFARTLELINHDRSSIINAIRKYARSERTLAETIAEKNRQITELGPDQVLEREALIAQRDWDIRIYDDRRTALPYLCEQPVLLEQRAFALGRAIAAELE